MKNIYILSSCNEWKEYSSMALVAATTSIRKVKSIIIQRIRNNEMEYKRGNDGLSKTKQIKMLHEDWRYMGENFVFDNLDYGYVEVVCDGEIQ